MMRYAHSYILLSLLVCHMSCGQKQTELSKDSSKSETKDLSTATRLDKYNIHTNYEYTDSIGKRLIIQNSLSKGGTKYTGPDGEVYNHVLFFTRIINETNNPLELKIDFPVDSYEVPSLPGKYFKILIPHDTMTLDKVPLYNYGMADLAPFLNKRIHKSSSLNRTINPKESSGFYVVMLCLIEGAHGTMRTGLSLKGQDLFYRIKIDGSKSNTKSIDKEIHCGSINLKNLILKK